MAPSALIVVLGDLGRSPRMANHARALLARGWRVTFAGYRENPLAPDLATHAEARFAFLRPGIGALVQLAVLAGREPWTAIVIQNPPGFPALIAVALTKTAGSRLVLDWHNLGSTLLALRPSGRRHWAWLYAACERAAAGLTDDHWAVSRALSAAVANGPATVVYDRPARSFCDAAAVTEDRLTWWRRTLPGQPFPLAEFWVVSPSSWGPDEDQTALLRVAQHWHEHRGQWSDQPAVVLLATGRGPGQPEFAFAAAALPAGPVLVQTLWLPPESYPALLGHADLGLCLHHSSSGWDLPMKLADFRGAALPALVYDYGPVLEEAFPEPAVESLSPAPLQRFRGDAQLAAALHQLARTPRGRRASVPLPVTWESEWDRQLGGWARARATERPVI